MSSLISLFLYCRSLINYDAGHIWDIYWRLFCLFSCIFCGKTKWRKYCNPSQKSVVETYYAGFNPSFCRRSPFSYEVSHSTWEHPWPCLDQQPLWPTYRVRGWSRGRNLLQPRGHSLCCDQRSWSTTVVWSVSWSSIALITFKSSWVLSQILEFQDLSYSILGHHARDSLRGLLDEEKNVYLKEG